MPEVEWADILIEAPDAASVHEFAKRLRGTLPATAHVAIGSAPEILITAPLPRALLVTGAVSVPGQTREDMTKLLRQATQDLGLRVNDGRRAVTLDLTVILLP